MSSKKLYETNLSERILHLSSLYSTNKEFLNKCGISNPAFITDIKRGRNKNPGADVLAKIIRGTGCNGTWLITGKGEAFTKNDLINQLVAEDDVSYQAFSHVIRLIERIEQTPSEIKELPLPQGIEIRIAELLLTLLKRHEDN